LGGAFTVLLSETESFLPALIALIAAGIATVPSDEGEIKKPFRRTGRATRLLGAAFVVATILSVIAFAAAVQPEQTSVRAALLSLMGLALFLLAPLHLVAGNLLATPVEALLRQGYIRSAQQVMADVNPAVIGVTGSYGKTTTKNFITDILNGRWRAYATPKSYNTMMGICIAINTDLADDYSVDYFIVEMGAYIEGEIRRICDLTPPQISVVVEVGPQHLERFGTLETIAKAKYEIIRALPPDGAAVFNWDNPYVREMYERGYPTDRIAVSRMIAPDTVPEGGPRFVAFDISESLDGLRFTVTDTTTGESERFETAVLGGHNVTNILLAVAVAVHEGMSLREVAMRARTLRPAESRLVRQTTPQGITIINDAYSANPVGIVSALEVLGMHTGGQRLLITPGMVELADLQEVENKKLGETAAQYATDVILVGSEQTRPIKTGLLSAGFPSDRIQVVEELRQAVAWYQSHLKPGDTVLFLNDLPDTY
jgi:UDP-N-acetylmuramoyl-tripeptide--D-alanyl-D-alanine ligase